MPRLLSGATRTDGGRRRARTLGGARGAGAEREIRRERWADTSR